MSHASRPLHIGRAFAAVPTVEPVECPNCGEPECDCDDESKELAEMSNCTGQDLRDRRTGEVRHQRCAWVEKSDWMGDPDVYRGTCSWKFAKCLACGAEVQKPYPDWLERKLPQQEEA
jgi:hypothetical protein